MKILTALSGGVDSSVVAALLKKQCHEVIGVHLQFWSEDFRPANDSRLPENKCCSLAALESARRIAGQLGIPFYVLNFRTSFKTKVVDYFLETYGAGQTPNPCVVCNREIKFGLLLQKMKELGCEAVATGHFARVRKSPSVPPRQKGKRVPSTRDEQVDFELLAGYDKDKDQSYFLYHLTQEKLRHILFPVGGKTKVEVFELAKKFGLKTLSDKKESQGACFFPEREPQDFLTRNLPKGLLRPGPIQTLDGKTIGRHKGLSLYTIGQRRGVELGGLPEPHYVIGFDRKKNTLLVGLDSETFSQSLTVKSLSWVSGVPPVDGSVVGVRTHYRMPLAKAKLQILKAGVKVEFTEPVRAITPGQAVVFYQGETVLGGGTIK